MELENIQLQVLIQKMLKINLIIFFLGENNNEDNTNKVDIEKIEIKEQDTNSVLSNNEKIEKITVSEDIEKQKLKNKIQYMYQLIIEKVKEDINIEQTKEDINIEKQIKF